MNQYDIVKYRKEGLLCNAAVAEFRINKKRKGSRCWNKDGTWKKVMSTKINKQNNRIFLEKIKIKKWNIPAHNHISTDLQTNPTLKIQEISKSYKRIATCIICKTKWNKVTDKHLRMHVKGKKHNKLLRKLQQKQLSIAPQKSEKSGKLGKQKESTELEESTELPVLNLPPPASHYMTFQ
eukprot:312445_1